MNQEKIGRFIANKRKEKKMTQEELAMELGVNNKTISRWETGKYMPDLSMFPLISDVLGVSINDLMSGEMVDKKDYQETFESNVVSMVGDINRKNALLKYLVMMILFFIVAFVLVSLFGAFFTAYKYPLKYDDNLLRVYETEFEELIYEFPNKMPYNTSYLIDSYTNKDGEEVGLIFIRAEQTLQYHYMEENSYDSCVDVRKCVLSKHRIDLSEYEILGDFKVYYTDINFEKIIKASNEELIEIIDKSNLVYDSMDKEVND